MGTQFSMTVTAHATVKAREQVVSAKERLDQTTLSIVILVLVAVMTTATPVYFGASEQADRKSKKQLMNYI